MSRFRFGSGSGSSSSSSNATSSRSGGFSFVLNVLLLGVVVALWLGARGPWDPSSSLLFESVVTPPTTTPTTNAMGGTSMDYSAASLTTALWRDANPLAIPLGPSEALPSVRTSNSNNQAVDRARKNYGGAGDGAHLGGFTELDLQGVSPATWSYMLSTLGVHSVLDVGCGKGVSTAWFVTHGCRPVLCVEGSHDAVTHSIVGGKIDPSHVVEHDFSRGPWWPSDDTFDAAWAVEFLEHVGVNYQSNYITAFRKAALLFVTSSRWGGWHHVEVHSDEWWIRKYEAYGFRYDAALTEAVRAVAQAEANNATHPKAPNGEAYNAQHIWLTMKVFVNPVVAALPRHAHLFPEHGCFEAKGAPPRICGTGPNGKLESALLPRDPYFPIPLPNATADEVWANMIRDHLAASK